MIFLIFVKQGSLAFGIFIEYGGHHDGSVAAIYFSSLLHMLSAEISIINL
jgi:hypothetical protein